MVAKAKSGAKTQIFLVAVAVIAALAFNNWLLGPWLNHLLFSRDGSVSEFSAADQPHHTVFRTLDIFAGCLMVLLAFGLAYCSKRNDRWRGLLVGSLAVLGIADVFDALLILRCSETLDRGCVIPVVVSWNHLVLPSHAYSSVVIAICYLVVPLAGWFYARTKHYQLLGFVSLLGVIVALVSLVSALGGYLSNQSLSVRTSGDGQEVQMLIIGLWLVIAALDISRGQREPRSKAAED